MANWDVGGITLKTIFYGQNTLKMANSRYRGITHKHIKHSKYGKFFIDETLWKWKISDIASILKSHFMDTRIWKWQTLMLRSKTILNWWNTLREKSKFDGYKSLRSNIIYKWYTNKSHILKIVVIINGNFQIWWV